MATRRGNSLTSIDTDELLWLKNRGGKWSQARTRPNNNYLRPFGFPKEIIYFVDKGIICGNIAKFCKDWQCDVGLVIQPGVRQAAES